MKLHSLWDEPLPESCKKNYRMGLIIALVASIAALLGFTYQEIDRNLPDRITILRDREEYFDFSLPLEAEIELSEAGTFFYNQEKLSSDQLRVSFNERFSVKAENTGTYPVALRLFGVFRMKQVLLDVIETTEIIPCGVPIGIIANTDGVLVLGTGKLTEESGANYEPDPNLLMSGDYITAVNGVNIKTKEELILQIQHAGEREVCLTVRRKDALQTVFLPVKETAGGDKKIGIWVRDDTQGIGTLTFLTSNGNFCALGHGITDVDTGILMEFEHGEIYTAEINSIVKGKEGEPGELTGVIHQGEKARIGQMEQNTPQGICGSLNMYPEQVCRQLLQKERRKPCEIAFWNEVQVGKAAILCTVDEVVEEYEIEIERIEPNGESLSKGLIIHITDERLLEKTGGIVQGMSGSPILQDGKLIGAVTHVFVRDSARGYGIFIENMLKLLPAE